MMLPMTPFPIFEGGVRLCQTSPGPCYERVVCCVVEPSLHNVFIISQKCSPKSQKNNRSNKSFAAFINNSYGS